MRRVIVGTVGLVSDWRSRADLGSPIGYPIAFITGAVIDVRALSRTVQSSGRLLSLILASHSPQGGDVDLRLA